MKRKQTTQFGALLMTAVVLTACSPSEPKNLAASQKRAMEKAQAVESQLKDAAAQEREQIDQLSR